jgi:ABC-type branched-subunit amino acid transport system substrate-binding protein
MQREGIETVYILYDKQVYGKGLADEVEESMEELGIEVLGRARG